MLASLLRIILLTATLKILERGLDKGPIIGYMEGFKGWSLIYQRTILMDTVLNIEYYRLHELTTGDAGNTLWVDVTYYFE